MTSFKEQKIEMQTDIFKITEAVAQLKVAQGKCQVDELPLPSLIGNFFIVTSLLPTSRPTHLGILQIPDMTYTNWHFLEPIT